MLLILSLNELLCDITMELKESKSKEFLQIGHQIIYFKSSEHMAEIEDESIDVIVTSPPYNRGKTYSADGGTQHNDNLSKEEYNNLLLHVWRECYRVLKQSGLFFLNICDAAQDQGKSEAVVHLAVKAGFKRIQTIAWVKSILGRGHFTPSGGERRLNNIWENIYLLCKDRKTYNLDPKAIGIPYADKSNIGRYSDRDLRDAGNVWLIPYRKTTGKTIKKGHDAPFPIELPYRCLKLVPNCKRVLDPFGGTCSTLAAAEYLRIEGIAYELYPRRNVIMERITNVTNFIPQKDILIPHLELSLFNLTKILKKISNDLELSPFFVPTSKKREVELQIMKEVLKNLKIKLPVTGFEFKKDTTLRQSYLTKFFKK